MLSRLYSKPESEIIPVEVEKVFTESESDVTEPIGGGDNPDVDW